MNVDEMKRLAAIMNPGRKVMVDVLGAVKTYLPGEEPGICKDLTEFNPSLTGSDIECKQALQVIVAAFAMPGSLSLHKMVTVKGTYFQIIHKSDPGLVHDDILTACSMALLDSAVENV